MDTILFAASEVFPFIKTGGLADVAASLPRALKEMRRDIRIVLPAYRAALVNARDCMLLTQWRLHGTATEVRVWETMLPQSDVPVWLVDHTLYDRDGGPYFDTNGAEWKDNAQRFELFCRAVVDIAQDRAGLNWRADILHCNDWQTGLVAPLLKQQSSPIATVFTIHNLAYQGLFDRTIFEQLHLPAKWWSMNAMEFYGKFSFIKGGLLFADMLSTVSPNYAAEITTEAFGCGLHPVLQYRSERLVGILNGIDTTIWDPRQDPLIYHHYGVKNRKEKVLNKTALQEKTGLAVRSDIPLIGQIGRMVQQKGIDLIIDNLPAWLEQDVQIIILGSGDFLYEKALRTLAQRFPHRLSVHMGYDEALAHQIEAACDIFLMPSRFEPCGLNQMYSLRYGTIPVVHGVGGLADTVTDLDKGDEATGFVFDKPEAAALDRSLRRALECFRNEARWRQLTLRAMKQDFSWKNSAKQYLSLYEQAQRHAVATPP